METPEEGGLGNEKPNKLKGFRTWVSSKFLRLTILWSSVNVFLAILIAASDVGSDIYSAVSFFR